MTFQIVKLFQTYRPIAKVYIYSDIHSLSASHKAITDTDNRLN
jgi:hypothetical protein